MVGPTGAGWSLGAGTLLPMAVMAGVVTGFATFAMCREYAKRSAPAEADRVATPGCVALELAAAEAPPGAAVRTKPATPDRPIDRQPLPSEAIVRCDCDAIRRRDACSDCTPSTASPSPSDTVSVEACSASPARRTVGDDVMAEAARVLWGAVGTEEGRGDGGAGPGPEGPCSGAGCVGCPVAQCGGTGGVRTASSLRADKCSDPYDPRPRGGYLVWDDYFMAIAFLSAQRSKDPNKQVGACIVSPENVILGIGYNGFPRGCPDEHLPWSKASQGNNPLETKYPYVCHAEMNAIMNKNSASLAGARIFVTMFPCNECAKLIIQSGLVEVVFYEDKNVMSLRDSMTPTKGGLRADPAYEASRTLLALAGVKLRQHRPREAVVVALMP